MTVVHYNSPAKGSNFVRFVQALALAKDNAPGGLEVASSRWGADSVPARICKAVVEGATLLPGSWGADLFQQEASAFFAVVAEQTIPGRMMGLGRVPLNVRLLTGTTPATAYWRGNGQPAPLTAMAYGEQALKPLEVSALAVITEELVRSTDPAAEGMIRAELIRAASQAIDNAFLDPTNAGVAEAKPASITYGATELNNPTSDPAEALTLLFRMFGGDWRFAHLIMDPDLATRIALFRDASGCMPYVADLGPKGGTLAGVPVLTSREFAEDSTGATMALVDASGIAYGDAGAAVRVSAEATIEMLSDPTNNAGTGTATELVSLFQTNAVATLINRQVNWKRARSNAVVVLTGANF